MSFISVEESQTLNSIPIFRLAFRVFFLFAGISSALFMAIWIYSFSTDSVISTYYPNSLWHAHEMIFGYTAAVIAGFLLTAIKNWTGIQTIKGSWLAILFLVWLSARVTPFLDIHPAIIAISSLLFFPLVTLAIAIPLLGSKSKSNYLFIPIMLFFAFADSIFQLANFNMIDWSPLIGINLAVHLIVILIVLMGGRVIPFFIKNTTNTYIASSSINFEKIMFSSLVIWTIVSLAPSIDQSWVSLTAGIAAALQLYRIKNWSVKKLWSIPMLWILYLGYIWIAIGLLLQAFASIFTMLPSLSTHALTTGAIGMITLGMMSRVALGHTGRKINHTKLILIAFSLISIVPILRVLWPLFLPEQYSLAIVISGVIWTGAFIVFSFVYWPILIQSRIDGKDG